MGGKPSVPSHLSDSAWFGAKPRPRKLIDLAAGRISLTEDLLPHELVWANNHGLIGVAADAAVGRPGAAVAAHYARLEARQAVMEQHLRLTLEQLSGKDIRATVVKGPFLAHAHYRVPGHRTFSDVDILVGADDIERTIDALRDLPFIGDSIPEQRPKSDKRDIPVYDLQKGVGFNIDLHWDLYSYTRLRKWASGATEAAWSQASLAEDHPLGPLWILPAEAELAFLCTHAWLDHRFRLILLRDLLEVCANGNIDWSRFLSYTSRWKLRSFSYVSLLIASRLLGAAVPEEVLGQLRVPSASLVAIERMLPRIDFVQFDGHKVHPLNLAAVVLHDERAVRSRTALMAPLAYPAWRKRVEQERAIHQVDHATEAHDSMMLVVSSNRRRGAEVFGEKLGDGLRTLDWDVDLVALWAGNEAAGISAETLTDQAPQGRLGLRLLWKLRREIASRRPDVVFANGGSTLRYAAIAMAWLRHRPLLAYSSIGEPRYWTRSKRHATWLRALHKRADVVLAVSEVTRQQLITDIGLDPDQIHTAHTGIDPAAFDVPVDAHDGPLRILFLGNLSTEKDPHAALRVAAAASVAADVRLRFVGAGPLRAELEAEVASRGLDGLIEFSGSVQDVRPELQWADVLLLTSRTEGFPGVVTEAAAARVPAVAYAAGGTGETMATGESGILVELGDEAGAAKALVELAGDPERRLRMGEAARALASSRFTLESSVRRYDAVVRDQLQKANGSASSP